MIGPIDVEKTGGASAYGDVAFNRIKVAVGRSVSGNTGGLHRHMKNLEFKNIGVADVKRLLFDGKIRHSSAYLTGINPTSLT